MNNSFIAYKSFIDAIRTLSLEDQLKCHNMIYDYALDGIEPTLNDGIIYTLFLAFKPQIDANSKKRSDGLKGGRPKKEEKQEVFEKETIGFEDENHRLLNPKPNVNENVNDNDNEHDNDNEYEKEKDKKEKAKRFSPPTLDEVISYCQERGNDVDPQKFIDFYESKGWMVGSNKMKDWRAAIRTWEKRENPKQQKEIPKYDQAFTDASLAISDADYEQFMKGRI